MNESIDLEKIKQLNGKTVVFDLDDTLVEGDLGEGVFFLLIIMQSLAYTTADIEMIFNEIRQGKTFTAPANQDLTTMLASYFSLLANENYAEAYQITAEYSQQFPREDIYKLTGWILGNKIDRVNVKLQLGDNEFALKLHVKQDPMMSALLKHVYAENAKIMIISASPQWSVEGFCKSEGVPVTFAHGAKKDGSGFVDVPFGKRKLEILQSKGIMQPYMVFGNGQGDLEMLEAAIHPIVRKGSHKSLLEKAEKQHWKII